MSRVVTALLVAAFLVAGSAAAWAETTCGTGHGTAVKAESPSAPPAVFASPQKEGTQASCPVTGEVFTIAKDTAHAEYKGKHVYFCCPGCKPQFDKEPERFIKSAEAKKK